MLCTCYVLHVRIIPVLISGSMFIGLDLTPTDRAKRMKGVFLSGRYLFTDFYCSLHTVRTKETNFRPIQIPASQG